MNDATTRILRDYIRLLRELFRYDAGSNTYSSVGFETVYSQHQAFWHQFLSEYLNGLKKLGYATYYTGSLTSEQAQISAKEYSEGKYWFRPDAVFSKQAMFSDAIVISDYVSDQFNYSEQHGEAKFYTDDDGTIRWGRKMVPTEAEKIQLCINAHQLLDLSDWIESGIIKLLPKASMLEVAYPSAYSDISSFSTFHHHEPVFNKELEHAKSQYEGPMVGELYYSQSGLFMFRESLFLHEEFGITPLYSRAMATIVNASAEFRKRLLPDSLIFDSFFELNSRFLRNLPHNKLIELRKEGYLADVRSFLRDEYAKVAGIYPRENIDYTRVMNQFRVNLQDKIDATEAQWAKLTGELEREYTKEVVRQSIVFAGSVFGLCAATYLNSSILQALMAIIGTSNLKDVVATLLSKRPSLVLDKKRTELASKNPLALYMVDSD